MAEQKPLPAAANAVCKQIQLWKEKGRSGKGAGMANARQMRILVLGSGLMGPAAALHLMADPGVAWVVLGDRDRRRLAAVARRLTSFAGAGKLEIAILDVADQVEAVRRFAEVDLVVSALPQALSTAAIRAAIAARRPLVDLTLPPAGEWPELGHRAEAAGVPVVIGCGVDPGLTEIAARHLAEKLDAVEELHLYCGGIPEKPQPPLGYKIVFGGKELPLRPTDAEVIEAGELRFVPRYSGAETLHFAGIGELEAYHEGFSPWLLELLALRGLRHGSQKTLRWPGYAAKVSLLRELGLLGREPVVVDGVEVTPFRLLNALLGPRVQLKRGELDITLFRVEASGVEASRPRRYRLEAVVRPDPARGLTAMARVTAFTAAITALLIGRGELREIGLLTPERAIHGALFDRLVTDLAAAGICFALTTEKTEPL
jgi:lysine 6-dehydrogenase